MNSFPRRVLSRRAQLLSGTLAALVLVLIAIGQPSIRAQSPPAEAAAIKGLNWRSIGPVNMGGRVADIEGVPGDAFTFYVVPANGGILKTTNNGTTFRSVFDSAELPSVGTLAIAPSDHSVLWAGTGEGDPRNSASFGNGVYRSTDSGDNWTHVGLTDTERIKRIRVHPDDPDTAFVCALGHAWGPNEERGVFRTTDAGKTWQKVLYKNADTGCSDIDMDPSNPRILYAGMYTYRRRPWRFDSGGGETALYKTTDAGATWKKLTDGLPKGLLDRIGVAISRSNPDIVYMISESTEPGTLWRSENKGETWTKVNDDKLLTFRPFYYSDMRVDPNDPNRLYTLGGQLSRSKDGGRTFERIASNVHGDHQAFWIDPSNSKRILSGSDGGYQLSYDGGDTFEIINNVPISQFYHVNVDMRQPYSLCGGLQDNGNWCGPSRTSNAEGIRTDDWYLISYGDGFWAIPEPDGRFVFTNSQGGPIYVTDTTTGAVRHVHPHPVHVGSGGEAIVNHKYRFNWNAGMAMSPHDPKTLYYGGNVLFRTTNRGQTWEVISPDLTTNDKNKQQSSGGPVTVDNTAAEFHCTILTIAESPVQRGVIWVGTDDGNIQVTRDNGKTWTNVVKNIAGLAPNSWVPAIEASHFDAGTAYVAVDRHRDDDFGPYAFKTTDFGKTWTPIKGNLPAKGYVHVVREDPKNRNLLYAGTEAGIYASWDGGGRWASIRYNLPPVSVNDLQVHPRDNDLIIATHSRGIFILDDVTPLQQLGDAMRTEAHAFGPQPAIRYAQWNKDADLAQKVFQGQNPPFGALVSYYLKNEAKEVNITISDSNGTVIREIRAAPGKAGVNRTAWDLKYEPATPTAAERSRGNRSQGGGEGGRFSGSGAALAIPGDYKIDINVDGKAIATTLKVQPDPRLQFTDADYRENRDTLLVLKDLTTRVNTMIDRSEDVLKQLQNLQDALKSRSLTTNPTAQAGHAGSEGQASNASNVAAAVDKAIEEFRHFRYTLTREINMGYRYPTELREEISALAGSVSSVQGAPTDPQKARADELKEETAQAEQRLAQLVSQHVNAINAMLSGQPHIR
jgi:photosystem II stability/assembly factor-like uncharacterized protein